MNVLLISVFLYFLQGIAVESAQNESIEIFDIDGQKVRVTHIADEMFYGMYKGKKQGFLLLNRDGTGEYFYDEFGVIKAGCKKEKVMFKWGFLVDENNKIVRFEREYGYSYPIMYHCLESACFQGCQKSFMIDYILLKNDKLVVSSSDDWEKTF